MTLPARIREACGVERFDVVHTQETLVAWHAFLTKWGITDEAAIRAIADIYRTAQREITTKTT